VPCAVLLGPLPATRPRHRRSRGGRVVLRRRRRKRCGQQAKVEHPAKIAQPRAWRDDGRSPAPFRTDPAAA
jgi:hypothetical protein